MARRRRKEFTLFDILMLINFRFADARFDFGSASYENSKTVRIHPDGDFLEWFEFGVSEWEDNKESIIKAALSADLLNRKVASIAQDDELGIIDIFMVGDDPGAGSEEIEEEKVKISNEMEEYSGDDF